MKWSSTFFLPFDLGEADFGLSEGAEGAEGAAPYAVPAIKACIAASSSTSSAFSILASNGTAKSASVSIKRRSTSD